jgi:hypothetical protein
VLQNTKYVIKLITKYVIKHVTNIKTKTCGLSVACVLDSVMSAGMSQHANLYWYDPYSMQAKRQG